MDLKIYWYRVQISSLQTSLQSSHHKLGAGTREAETVAKLTEEREALRGQVILTRDWSTYPQY